MTAYELCEKVLVKLEQEPENYCQLTWQLSADKRSEVYLKETSRKFKEGCGTSYCIGGWMQTILGHQSVIDTRRLLAGIHNGVAWYDLTRASALSADLEHYYDVPKVGTRAYAALGIKHLKNWMQKYEQELRQTDVGEPKRS